MDSFFTKHIREFFILILLALWLISLRTIISVSSEKQDIINAAKIESQTFKTTKNKLEETIIAQNAITVHDKKVISTLIEELDLNKKKVKNPQVIIKEKLVTELKNVYVKYTDTSIIDTNLIKVPKYFSDSTKFYCLKGTINAKDILFTKISFPLNTTHIINNKRYNIFYTQPELIVHYDNPYTETRSVQTIILKKQPNRVGKVTVLLLTLASGFYLVTLL